LPEGAISTPERGTGDSAICPGCREPLTRIGEASRTVVIKLTNVKSRKDLRLPLEVGRELVFGRVERDISLAEVLKGADLARISRTHAKIGFDGNQLYFEDLGSSNGSTIAFWDPIQLRLLDNLRISQNQKIVIQPRDLIVLANVLEIQRSGRRFPFDLAQPASNPHLIRESPKTNIFKGE
jgi:pSer/pThr/pTyr-binding forkhead associated (FHA) protein